MSKPDCLCDKCEKPQKLPHVLSSMLESFLVAWLVMLGFKYLHHDVRSVPPLGYWSSFFASAAIVVLARSVRGPRE